MRKFIVAVIVIAVFAVMLVFSLSDSSGLQVTAQQRVLIITNIRTRPVQLRDVVLNDRLECSQWPQDNLYSSRDLHVLWVKGQIPMVTGVSQIKAIAASDDHWPEIKSGETLVRASVCEMTIVRATVKTDAKTLHYELK